MRPLRSLKPLALCFAIVVVGFFASSYLFTRHLGMKSGAAAGTGGGFCSAVFGAAASCDEALLSPVSERFGMPLAGWGMVYFSGLAALLLIAAGGGRAEARPAASAAFFASLVGAAVGVALSAQMLAGASPKCPLCFSIHAADLALPLALRRLANASLPEMARAVLAAIFGAARRRRAAMGLGTAALAAFSTYQWASIREARSEAATTAAAESFDAAEAIAAYDAAPIEIVEAPAPAPAKRLGPDSAPARLLVFSDFQCPGCAAFAMAAKKLQEEFPERLQLAYRHFPLNQACNAAASKDLHASACEASLVSEGAARQGKFWAFHDALFANSGKLGQGEIESALAAARVDMAAMKRDWESGALHQAVLDDIAAAVEARIPGTPAVYLNGRRLTNLSPRALETVVKHAIETSDPGRSGLPQPQIDG